MMLTINSRHLLAVCCGAMIVLGSVVMGAARAADDAATANLKARLAKVEKDLAQLTETDGKDMSETGIPLHGFADVGYTRSSKRNDTRLDQAGKGFWANSLDFYLTPQFNDRTKGLIELIFEFLPDGLATDLERIQLGYIFSDQLTVWMGRFHAPYGYWNTGFHHGSEIQTSVSRPRFIDFEDKGGLLPAHVMGAWANGDTRVGSGRLAYDVYAGNGNAIVGVDTTPPGTRGFLTINNARDSNNNTLMGGNLGYKIGGLIVGAHGFSQRVNIEDANPVGMTGEVSVKMTGLYGAYEDDNWETIAEYYHFKNDDLITTPGAPVTNSSWLSFAQVGYAVGNDWMPYLRLEKASLDQDDPYFNTQGYGYSYSRQVLGARYTLNAKAVLKLEVNRTKEGDGVLTAGPDNGSYSEAKFQYSIRF